MIVRKFFLLLIAVNPLITLWGGAWFAQFVLPEHWVQQWWAVPFVLTTLVFALVNCLGAMNAANKLWEIHHVEKKKAL